MEVYHDNTNAETENNRELTNWSARELERQRGAREAVMQVPLFPALERELVKALGPNAETIMLHQLVYWYRKGRVSNRWTIYKTFGEWRDERGLTRRQVEAGRQALRKKGLVEEVKGLYKRVHYRLDWVKLAETLTLNLSVQPESEEIPAKQWENCKSERTDMIVQPEIDHNPLTYGENIEKIDKNRVQTSLYSRNRENSAYVSGKASKQGVQTNTGDYAGDYVQDNSLYKGAKESDSRTLEKENGSSSESGTSSSEGSGSAGSQLAASTTISPLVQAIHSGGLKSFMDEYSRGEDGRLLDNSLRVLKDEASHPYRLLEHYYAGNHDEATTGKRVSEALGAELGVVMERQKLEDHRLLIYEIVRISRAFREANAA